MSFDEKVYGLVARIPEGRVTTYGELARAAGKPGAGRLIGRILNRNPNPVVVPCHRVVKSDGKVGGYALGSGEKTKLLETEGVKISRTRKKQKHKKNERRIMDFEDVKYEF